MKPRHYAIIFLAVITAGCSSKDSMTPANANAPATSSPATVNSPATSTSVPGTAAVKAKVDVCALLTSDDLKTVQGEAFKDAQRSDREDGGFIVAQCYYALPTTVNSVVLNLTTAKEGSGTASPRKFWEQTFGKDEGQEKWSKERQRERERAQKNKGQEPVREEEAGPKPEKISGLGDEAFWIASRVGGALYVLKKDQFFRISVGGAGDEKTKLSKSKTLAQRVLNRL